ncbi:MAG TPA: hypothetical protein VEQ41_01600 [Solirubrobacterales bacterium]|nr:hypothetical protein [Solirubrobacterales bacterium]
MALGGSIAPGVASADFGFKAVDVTFTELNGSASLEAGSHPFAMTTTLEANTALDGSGNETPEGDFKDIVVDFPAGLVATPDSVPPCPAAQFLDIAGDETACPNSSALGFGEIEASTAGPIPAGVDFIHPLPVYNLEPSPGAVAKIGFVVVGLPVTVDLKLRDTPPYNGYASVTNIPQAAFFYGSELTVWGVPADSEHDDQRGLCALGSVDCAADIPKVPFLTLPRSCTGPAATVFKARPWQQPKTDDWAEATAVTHDVSPPVPLGFQECDSLRFRPEITARPTSQSAESPTGLDFSVDIADEGLTSPDGRAHSDIRKAVVTLPSGVTVNPSVAEGLAVCTPAQLGAERVGSAPGAGCPEASKLGTVEVETPLLEGKVVRGAVFVAQQDDPSTPAPGAENPFDTLIALYIVIKDPGLGVLLKLAGKVEPNPVTGQLTTTFDDLPQLPFSHFRFKFREGGRSPLVTPPTCGAYTTEARFTPWADPADVFVTSAPFEVARGIAGGPCPPAGVPPFAPGFQAGTLNNDAGAFSPFNMRLTRRDGDQDMTRFSSQLPPGLLGKLAGVAQCPDAAIAAARGKTGRQEIATPSCPPGAQIGRTLAGAGVGSELTYVPGKLYLAGPVGDSPLSVVAIVPAVAGPFDAGTVVVRVALSLNRRTAAVEVDGANSEPIPHILKGIPLKVRDLRVYVDRPDFTLNPTSCDPMEVRATLFGGYLDVFSSADDVPVRLATPFQAANCLNLGFKPRLRFRLKGGVRRGDHPAVRAVLLPRPGDANLSRAAVRLPRSAFLDQAHIGTVCTRVQFAADKCPPGSIYGHVRAFSPLLEQPLEGPAYLRSSDNLLPDMVFDLRGLVDIEASARIDSIKGGLRLIFAGIPDAPVSKVIASFPAGKKGLIVNSRNLCLRKARAKVRFDGHNTKRVTLRPLMRATGCSKRRQGKRR